MDYVTETGFMVEVDDGYTGKGAVLGYAAARKNVSGQEENSGKENQKTSIIGRLRNG